MPAYSGYLDKANEVQNQVDRSAADRAIKAAFAMNYAVYADDLVTWTDNKVTSVSHEKATEIMADYNDLVGTTSTSENEDQGE